MSKKRFHKYLVLAAVAVGGLYVVFWLTDDPLWRAVVRVESGGNARAYNKSSDAAGIAQITRRLVDDCNRIVGERRFSHDDRWSPRASREMFEIYTRFWGRHYEDETGKRCSDEIRARIWNGGPEGYKLGATQEYWARVRRAW